MPASTCNFGGILSPPLPNLERLVWMSKALLSHAMLFVQPTLVSLSYPFTSMMDVRSVLTYVRTDIPRIQELKFNQCPPGVLTFLRDELSGTISRLRYLTTFENAEVPLSPRALLHLSRLPQLKTVALCIDKANHQAWSNPSWGRFRALRNLTCLTTILANGDRSVASFLRTLCGAQVTRLELCLAPWVDFEDLGNALATFPHLECLEISGASPHAWGDTTIDGRIFASLREATSMRSFTLRNVPVHFTSRDIHDLTAGWHNLEVFTIHVSSNSWHQLPLETLAVFARNCPELHTLAVQFEPVAGGWQNSIHSITPFSNLSQLDVQQSTVAPEAEGQVAAFFAKVFPYGEIRHGRVGLRETAEPVFERINTLKRSLVAQVGHPGPAPVSEASGLLVAPSHGLV